MQNKTTPSLHERAREIIEETKKEFSQHFYAPDPVDFPNGPSLEDIFENLMKRTLSLAQEAVPGEWPTPEGDDYNLRDFDAAFGHNACREETLLALSKLR